MFQRLIRSVLGGEPAAEAPPARPAGFGRRTISTPSPAHAAVGSARIEDVLSIPSRPLRAVFEARLRNEPHDGVQDEAMHAALAVALGDDPLALAIELFVRSPLLRVLAGRSSDPGMRRLNASYAAAADFARRAAVARHGNIWPVPPHRLELAIKAVGALIALGENSTTWGIGQFFPPIIAAAGRRSGEHAIRTAVAQAFSDGLEHAGIGHDSALRLVEAQLDASGLRREDVPALVATDARTARLNRIRAAILADAGEPLAAAIAAVLDREPGTQAFALRDAEKHPAIRALADLSPEDRGQALHRLLGLIEGLPARGVDKWGELERDRGRYREGIHYQPQLSYMKHPIATLASRKIVLPDADGDVARLLKLMPHFPALGNKRIAELVMATVRAHPRGRAIAVLRDLFAPTAPVNPLKDWAIEVEDALRDAAAAASAAASTVAAPRASVPLTGFGRKGVSTAPVASPSILPNLPPIDPPDIRLGNWGAHDALSAHYANLFEARLHDRRHQAQLAALAELAEAIRALPADVPERAQRIEQLARRTGLPLYADHDNWRRARCIEEVALEGADIARRMAAFEPMVLADPEGARGLGRLTAAIAGKSAPPASWLKEGRALVADVPAEQRLAMLDALVSTPTPTGSGANSEPYLRALLYLSADLDAAVLGPKLAEYALKSCYVTLPNIGIRAEKLGNASLWTLAAMPAGAGIPYLARILARTKYPKIRARIDATLNAAAEAAGMTRATLDELTVPTHGLDREGTLRLPLAEGEAVIRLEGGRDVAVEWLTGAGKAVKAPTAAMKADKAAIKVARDTASEIEADLATLAGRMQRHYLEDRSWPAATWRERYLDHPLVRALAGRLVWWVEPAEGPRVAVLPDGDALRDVTGRSVSAEGATIRPWHPIDAGPAEVEAWRDRIEALELTQPFAQIWREVYAITDAERTTGTYSLRWAAHILRQHQAMTLARLNGWRVTHRMWVDAPNDERWHLTIPAHGLVADYWVEGSGGEDPAVLDSGAYVYVATDRVQFHTIDPGAADSASGPARGAAVALVDLPPIVFSEVMRQADLLTSVASIAADPNWLDRGADAAHPSQWDRDAARYWTQVNSADLEESGKRRRALLERIVPRLKIADRLGFADRYLTVKGTRHDYRIHIGSGASFRGERHICIVPSSEQAGGRIWLPFEGDRTLSIILAKAVLLAADDKITDPVILNQL